MSLADTVRRRPLVEQSLFARVFSAMWANLRGSEGAEILEFAISLPLLIVVAVGVFDFGSAFTVKQKVGNIALQGARVASNQPTTDLFLNGACGAPASICSVSWTFTANAGCGGTLTLQIERGYIYTATLPSPPFQAGNYTMEGTRVTLNYPYRWQFNRVAPLIAPGANYPATTQINSVAIMQNLN